MSMAHKWQIQSENKIPTAIEDAITLKQKIKTGRNQLMTKVKVNAPGYLSAGNFVHKI